MELVSVLRSYAAALDLPDENTRGRLTTAVAASELLDRLHHAADPTALVSALARAELDTPLVVLARSIASARQVADALRKADWRVLDRLATLDGPDAESVRRTLRTEAAADENAAPLGDALAKARDRTLALIVEPASPTSRPAPSTMSVRGRRDAVLAQLRDALGADDRIEVTYRILDPADDDR